MSDRATVFITLIMLALFSAGIYGALRQRPCYFLAGEFTDDPISYALYLSACEAERKQKAEKE
jgi:hypothetical protein